MLFQGLNYYGVPQYSVVPVCLRNRLTSRKYVKVKFTPEEDVHLLDLVDKHETTDWISISALMGDQNPRQCRERYKNYLNPKLCNRPWTPEEDALLENKVKQFGTKWNSIGRFFTRRSDISLRNRWMMIKRRCTKGESMSLSDEIPLSPVPIEEDDPIADIVHIGAEKEEARATRMTDDPFQRFDPFHSEAPTPGDDSFQLW
jgi:hypothetical protein